jgi:hypothetical protein
MRRLLPALLLLAVACASSPSQNPYRPSVNVLQLNAMNFGATTSSPITIEVQIRNTATQPILVRTIRLEGGLTQQYQIRGAERAVRETIAPGETRGVRLQIVAVSQQGRIQDPEPLNLRGFVTYNAGGQQFQDLYLFRVLMQ